MPRAASHELVDATLTITPHSASSRSARRHIASRSHGVAEADGSRGLASLGTSFGSPSRASQACLVLLVLVVLLVLLVLVVLVLVVLVLVLVDGARPLPAVGSKPGTAAVPRARRYPLLASALGGGRRARAP